MNLNLDSILLVINSINSIDPVLIRLLNASVGIVDGMRMLAQLIQYGIASNGQIIPKSVKFVTTIDAHPIAAPFSDFFTDDTTIPSVIPQNIVIIINFIIIMLLSRYSPEKFYSVNITKI